MTTLALPSPSVIDRMDPLQQAVLGYLAKYRTPTTYRAYRADLLNWLAYCEREQLAPLLVKRVHLDMYIRWMQDQNRWSESTISRRVGVVRGLYRYAAREDIITKDPAVDLDMPTVDRAKQRRTVLSPIEFAMLLKAAERHGPDAHALVCLLGMMGLRIGELCSLNVEHLTIDAGYRVLHFVGKGNRAAHVPVPIPVMRALEDVIADRAEGPLIRNRRGERIDRPTAARLLRRLARSAGVETDFSCHSLRRTFCTTGLLFKVPIYEMQIAMRHQSTRTTALYDMASTSLDRNATHQVAGCMAALAG